MRYIKIFLVLLLCNSSLLAEELSDEFIDFSAGYSQGDFNSGQNSEFSQLQVTYGKVRGDYNFSISLPYFFLSDSFGNEAGLGDITVRAGKTLSGNSFSEDNVYASVSVKLPTANESNGLGTGEMDVGGFLSYTHYFNSLSLTLMGGYIVTGDSQAQLYKDIFVYGIGLSKIISPWYIYGNLDGRQQTLDTGDDLLEASIGVLYQVKPEQFLKLEGFVGLSNTSPDSGMSIGIVNWF